MKTKNEKMKYSRVNRYGRLIMEWHVPAKKEGETSDRDEKERMCSKAPV